MAKGEKTGGRKRGTPNKATSAAAKKAEKIAASGETPLEYLLSVMRDEKEDRPVRMDAAKAAAPYIHPKLANIEHTGPDGGAIKVHMIAGDENL
jgi:hypothetical protein